LKIAWVWWITYGFLGLISPGTRVLWSPECLFDADACVYGAKEAGKSLIFAWCACLKVLYEF